MGQIRGEEASYALISLSLGADRPYSWGRNSIQEGLPLPTAEQSNEVILWDRGITIKKESGEKKK